MSPIGLFFVAILVAPVYFGGMYVRVTPRKNGKTAVQIVESHRVGKKVAQKVVRHVGQAATDKELDEIKKLAEFIIQELKKAKTQPYLPLLAPELLGLASARSKATDDQVYISNLREQQRVTLGITEIFGRLYDDLGLNSLLFRSGEEWHSILKNCVIARVANPASKRKTALLFRGRLRNKDSIT